MTFAAMWSTVVIVRVRLTESELVMIKYLRRHYVAWHDLYTRLGDEAIILNYTEGGI